MNIPILVVSCDAYQDVWHPFFHCFFKNWSECPHPVHLVSNMLTYPDKRVSPLLIGADVDYSSNLITAVSQIPDEWLIFWIDDRPPAFPVDTTRLAQLMQLAQSQEAGYFRLIPSNPPALVEQTAELGEIPKGSRYRISMTVALWRKSTLLKILRAGETAWDIEKRGGVRSNEIDDKFFALPIGVRQNAPLVDVHLISKGKLIQRGAAFLKQEGLLHHLENRSQLKPWQHLYYELYQPVWNLYYKTRWQLMKAGVLT